MLVVTADGHLTTDTTGPVELKRLLSLFESEMGRAGWDGRGQAPGQSRTKIVDAFGRVGLIPPEELIVYFEWHDSVMGQEDGSWFGPVYPGFSPERMDWCLEGYQNDLAANLDLGSVEPNWLLLEEGSGYAVHCGRDPQQAPEVLYVSEADPIEGRRNKPRMLSMCTLVEGWISLIRAGVYYWQDNGWRANPSRASAVEPSEALELFR